MVDLLGGTASKADHQSKSRQLRSLGTNGPEIDRALEDVHDVISSHPACLTQNASMMIMLPPPCPMLEDHHYFLHSQRCGATTTSPQQVSVLSNPQDPDQLPPMDENEPTIADVMRILRRMERRLSDLSMSNAEEQCDNFTVKIKMEKPNEGPVNGHGVVMYANGQYYLASCFHVFLSAWNRFGVYGHYTTTIAWANRPTERIKIHRKQLMFSTCIAEELYFVDVAMYRIAFLTPPKHLLMPEKAVVQVETKELGGRKVLAKSTTRMEGFANELTRTKGSDIETAYNEYMSTATATPGTSGSVSFDNRDKFIGFVRRRGNVDVSSDSDGLTESLAQSSHFGVSPAGLDFAEVDPAWYEFLQRLITLKKSKPVDMDIQAVLEEWTQGDFASSTYQEALQKMFVEDGFSISFRPDDNDEVHMTLVKVSVPA